MSVIEFRIEPVAAHLVLARRAIVDLEALGDFFGPAYEQMVEICDAAGVEIIGCRAYYFSGPENGSIDVAAAFVVREDAADALRAVLAYIEEDEEDSPLKAAEENSLGLLSLNHYPEKLAAICMHHGSYDELGAVWDHFGRALRNAGYDIEPTSFEDYVDMGDEHNPDTAITALYWFIKD